MHETETSTSEVAILSRVIEPEKATFAPEAARAILALDFNAEDKNRMRQLSSKAQEGTLTRREKTEINNYERAGHVLNILQSKARLSLKSRRGGNGRIH
jgi:hypothetical protein